MRFLIINFCESGDHWQILSLVYLVSMDNNDIYYDRSESTNLCSPSTIHFMSTIIKVKISIFKIPGNLCSSVVVNMQYAKTFNLIIIEFNKSIFDSRNLCICVVVVNMQCQLISLCPTTVCVSHFKWCWYLLPPRSSSDTQMTHKHNGRPAHLSIVDNAGLSLATDVLADRKLVFWPYISPLIGQ